MKNTLTKAQTARIERLLPSGKPRYIRCYDNGGKTADRYTIIYTGNYNNIGKPVRDFKAPIYYSAGMSHNPTNPQGVCFLEESFGSPLDKPSYKRLGKKITYEMLPGDVKKVILKQYKDIWGI